MMPAPTVGAQDGRKAAKARGVQFGRKPKLTQRQQAEGRRRLETWESGRSIARDGITPSLRGCGWLRLEGDLGDYPSSTHHAR